MQSKLRRPLTREDVVRIDRILIPEQHLKGEGLYEWSYNGDKYTLDLIDLLKELERLLPGRSWDISDRLMNFPQIGRAHV